MNTSLLSIVSIMSMPLLKGLGSKNIPPVPEVLQSRWGHFTEDYLSPRQKECYDYGFKGVMPLAVFLDLWALNPRLVNLDLLEKEYEMTGTVELNTAIIPYMSWYPVDIREMFTKLYDSPRTASHIVEFEIPKPLPMLNNINCFDLGDPNKFEYYQDVVFPCFNPLKINKPSGIWVFAKDLEDVSSFIEKLKNIYFFQISIIGPSRENSFVNLPVKFLNALGSLKNVDYNSTAFDFINYYGWYSFRLVEGSDYDYELYKLLRGQGSALLKHETRNFPSRRTIYSIAPTWENKTLLPWILSIDPIFEEDDSSELRRF